MKTTTVLMSLMISTLTFAGMGEGHSHGHKHGHGHSHGHEKTEKIDAKKAEELARKKIKALTFQNKINKSWSDAKLASIEIKEFKNKNEWFVTFTNEKGVKGKTLYVFLKLDGEFVAANFTGK